jgi:hypothetical protein
MDDEYLIIVLEFCDSCMMVRQEGSNVQMFIDYVEQFSPDAFYRYLAMSHLHNVVQCITLLIPFYLSDKFSINLGTNIDSTQN